MGLTIHTGLTRPPFPPMPPLGGPLPCRRAKAERHRREPFPPSTKVITTQRFTSMIIRLLLSLFTLLIGVVASAQTPLAGTITGRVFVPGTGEYLERARISLEGSGREAFTDTLGRYSFYDVPAGVVSV